MADQTSEAAELPPYRAVLVVDAKGFGSNSDPNQEFLAQAIPEVMKLTFERAGLQRVWLGALFPHNSGDGLGIGFDTRHLPAVIPRLFDTLQDVLAEQDQRLRTRGRDVRLRLRASLNIGPVREPDPRGQAGVVGQAVITTHRLLDAPAVRNLLERSDPDETFLAVALSQRVIDDVVASGYAQVPKSRLVPVAAQVKEFTGTIYLYVPRPSGDLLTRGMGEPDSPPATPLPTTPPSAVTNSISGGTHSGTTIQVGHLHGGIHDDR